MTSISRQIQNTDNINVSRCTVSRHLNEIGLFARRPMKKPSSKKNKKERLDFAYKFVNKPQNWWNKVYFSDESKFNLFGSDKINYVRWFQNEKFNAKNTKKKLLNLEVTALWYLVCFHKSFI